MLLRYNSGVTETQLPTLFNTEKNSETSNQGRHRAGQSSLHFEFFDYSFGLFEKTPRAAGMISFCSKIGIEEESVKRLYTGSHPSPEARSLACTEKGI